MQCNRLMAWPITASVGARRVAILRPARGIGFPFLQFRLRSTIGCLRDSPVSSTRSTPTSPHSHHHHHHCSAPLLSGRWPRRRWRTGMCARCRGRRTRWSRPCSPTSTSSPWPTHTGRPASTSTAPCKHPNSLNLRSLYCYVPCLILSSDGRRRSEGLGAVGCFRLRRIRRGGGPVWC